MGYREIELSVPVVEQQELALQQAVQRKLRLTDCTLRIVRKSLDARRQDRIRWQYRVSVSSAELKGGEAPRPPVLEPEYQRRNERVVVVGTGPAPSRMESLVHVLKASVRSATSFLRP